MILIRVHCNTRTVPYFVQATRPLAVEMVSWNWNVFAIVFAILKHVPHSVTSPTSSMWYVNTRLVIFKSLLAEMLRMIASRLARYGDDGKS